MPPLVDPQLRECHYIDGAWLSPAGEETIEVIDPATEQTIGRVPAGTAADVDRAVGAARAVFDEWSGTAPAARAEYLRRIAAGLVERSEELSELITSELGCPLETTRWLQVEHGARAFDAMADVVDTTVWSESSDNFVVMREPLGVAGAITPWNYPLDQIVGKVAPALAAGCTVIIKPSEVAPLNAFVLAEVMHEVGLPPGVVNVVTGYGPVVGEAIADHADVDKVSFTGSTSAGCRVAELGARTVKSVTLELGGKSANVVLEDADVRTAVEDGVGRCFLNSGQTCNATARLLIHRDRLDEAEQVAARAAETFTTGDPFSPDTRLGPLVSRSQRDRVRAYIESGSAQGARLVTGGADAPAGLDRGYFVRPTVFSDVRPEMTIAQEEIFGPVLSIMPYDDEDEALEIANGTVYGLVARIWSRDPDRIERFARCLRAGQIYLNDADFEPDAPFGGHKQSGVGREHGKYGLDEYLQTKAMIVR